LLGYSSVSTIVVKVVVAIKTVVVVVANKQKATQASSLTCYITAASRFRLATRCCSWIL